MQNRLLWSKARFCNRFKPIWKNLLSYKKSLDFLSNFQQEKNLFTFPFKLYASVLEALNHSQLSRFASKKFLRVKKFDLIVLIHFKETGFFINTVTWLRLFEIVDALHIKCKLCYENVSSENQKVYWEITNFLSGKC